MNRSDILGALAAPPYNPHRRQRATVRNAEEIVVWESRPYWGPELQRQLGPSGGRVRPGSPGMESIDGATAGQVVFAPPTGSPLPLTELRRWIVSGLPVHIVLEPPEGNWRWFLLELGASSVFNFIEARQSLASTIGRFITNKVV